MAGATGQRMGPPTRNFFLDLSRYIEEGGLFTCVLNLKDSNSSLEGNHA